MGRDVQGSLLHSQEDEIKPYQNINDVINGHQKACWANSNNFQFSVGKVGSEGGSFSAIVVFTTLSTPQKISPKE